MGLDLDLDLDPGFGKIKEPVFKSYMLSTNYGTLGLISKELSDFQPGYKFLQKLQTAGLRAQSRKDQVGQVYLGFYFAR